MPSNARKIDKTKNELKIGTVFQKRNLNQPASQAKYW